MKKVIKNLCNKLADTLATKGETRATDCVAPVWYSEAKLPKHLLNKIK